MLQYGCDDGNLLNGDGCDANCYVETGYYCNRPFEPDYCYPRWRPMVIGANLSTDGHHLFIYWNTSVIIAPDTELDVDWELIILGPRDSYNYTWDFAD